MAPRFPFASRFENIPFTFSKSIDLDFTVLDIRTMLLNKSSRSSPTVRLPAILKLSQGAPPDTTSTVSCTESMP